MDIRKVNDTFSVCGQIGTDNIPVIAAMGFRSILCNRPDGESADQTTFEAVEAVAKRADLAVAYLPVAPSGPQASDIAAFKSLFRRLPKPVLAYCGTGQRSLAIWSASVGAEIQ